MEIKALDNSAAGAGVHVRLYFSINNDDCLTFAYRLRNFPAENDQNDLEMSSIWNDASFGTITRRSAMRSCKNWKKPSGAAYPNTVSNYKSVVALTIT
jgi:hypothetical protein